MYEPIGIWRHFNSFAGHPLDSRHQEMTKLEIYGSLLSPPPNSLIQSQCSFFRSVCVETNERMNFDTFFSTSRVSAARIFFRLYWMVRIISGARALQHAQRIFIFHFFPSSFREVFIPPADGTFKPHTIYIICMRLDGVPTSIFAFLSPPTLESLNKQWIIIIILFMVFPR